MQEAGETSAPTTSLAAIGQASKRKRSRQRQKPLPQATVYNYSTSTSSNDKKQELNQENGRTPKIATESKTIPFNIPSPQNCQYLISLDEMDLSLLPVDWTISNGPTYWPAMDNRAAMEWTEFELSMHRVDGIDKPVTGGQQNLGQAAMDGTPHELSMERGSGLNKEGQYKGYEDKLQVLTAPKNDVRWYINNNKNKIVEKDKKIEHARQTKKCQYKREDNLQVVAAPKNHVKCNMNNNKNKTVKKDNKMEHARQTKKRQYRANADNTVSVENVEIRNQKTQVSKVSKKDMNKNKNNKSDKNNKTKKSEKNNNEKTYPIHCIPPKSASYIPPKERGLIKLQPKNFIISSSNEDSWPKLGEKRPKYKCDQKTDYEMIVQEKKEKIIEQTHEETTTVNLIKVFNENNDVIMVVPLYNWHGIVCSTEYKDILFCTLCLEGFIGEDECAIHTSQQKHLRLVQSPPFMAEKHGIRQLTNSLFHCILCNVALHDALDHISTKTHELESAKSDRYIANKKPKTEQIVEENKKKKRSTVYAYDYDDPTDLYYCPKCDEELPNFARQIVVHKNSKRHKANLQEYQNKTKNSIQKGRHDFAHSGGIVVATWVLKKSIKKLKKNNIPENTNDYCTVCDIDVGKSNLEQHLLGKSHKKCQRNLKSMPTHTVGYNICNKCHVIMPNNYSTIKYHYEGRRHKNRQSHALDWNKLKDLGDGFYCEPCEITISENMLWHHVKTDLHKFALRRRFPSKPHYCCTCNVWVQRNNRQLHIQGRRHQMNVANRFSLKFMLP